MIKLSEITATEFDQFAKHHLLGSIYQDSRWAKAKVDTWGSKFIALQDKSKILIAGLVLVRRLPLGFKLWYLPRGPLFDPKGPEILTDFSKQLVKLARRERALVVKADPNVLVSSMPFLEAKTADRAIDKSVIDCFKAAGWRHAGLTKSLVATIQPRVNAVLYLPSEDLLAALPKKTRKIIERGLRMGVTVRSIDVTEITNFMQMIKATEDRQQISLRDKSYFSNLKTIFGDDCLMTLTTIDPQQFLTSAQQHLVDLSDQLKKIDPSRHNKIRELEAQKSSAIKFLDEAQNFSKQYQQQILLSASLSLYKDQTLEMIYSGMEKKFSSFYAPHVSNWFRFEWAKSRGALKCNLGGVDGSLNDSLTEFKSAFGVNIDQLVGEFSLYTYPIISWSFDKLLPKLKAGFKKFRRLKSK